MLQAGRTETVIEFTGRVNGQEYLLIRVINLEPEGMVDPARGQYTLQIGLRNPNGWDETYQRHLSDFPRFEKNLLGMLDEIIKTLPEEALKSGTPTFPADMARRQPRVVPEVQAGEGKLHHHRSPFWRRQPKQAGGDS